VTPTLLRPACNPDTLGFDTTDELEPIDTLIGQERALGAIRFGSAMNRPGYNLFALGPQGTGRHSAVLSFLGKKAENEIAPDDWAYVHNFSVPHKPKAMRLPTGSAIPFRDAMAELVMYLRSAIPSLFQSEDYTEKRRAIDAELEETQEKAFEVLRTKAEAQNVGILRTQMGFALAPLQDGQVIKPEIFNKLPEAERKQIEAKIEVLQDDLADALGKFPQLEKQRREKIRALNADVTGSLVDASIKGVAERFAEIEPITERLVEIRKDLIENVELFLTVPEGEANSPLPQSIAAQPNDPRFNRYQVNVIVASDTDGDKLGAPLVCEDHPTLSNLVGRIEHQSQFGALVTDFTMIRPGALHLANGGYLVLDARKILTEAFSWEALKRALRGNAINIVSAAEQLSLVSTTSLEPEAIPLKVKVVLVGERLLYYLLSNADPEFAELFKVEVDFDEELTRSPENIPHDCLHRRQGRSEAP